MATRLDYENSFLEAEEDLARTKAQYLARKKAEQKAEEAVDVWEKYRPSLGAIVMRIRRGTTAQHNNFIGAPAEITVDINKDTLVVHDGKKVGGYPLAREDHTHDQYAFKNHDHGDIYAPKKHTHLLSDLVSPQGNPAIPDKYVVDGVLNIESEKGTNIVYLDTVLEQLIIPSEFIVGGSTSTPTLSFPGLMAVLAENYYTPKSTGTYTLTEENKVKYLGADILILQDANGNGYSHYKMTDGGEDGVSEFVHIPNNSSSNDWWVVQINGSTNQMRVLKRTLDLSDYYTKSEVYTKAQVDGLIDTQNGKHNNQQDEINSLKNRVTALENDSGGSEGSSTNIVDVPFIVVGGLSGGRPQTTVTRDLTIPLDTAAYSAMFIRFKGGEIFTRANHTEGNPAIFRKEAYMIRTVQDSEPEYYVTVFQVVVNSDGSVTGAFTTTGL